MPDLKKENLFTPWANRHGVTVIAAMPIGEGFWTILAVRMRLIMGEYRPEYIAWEFSEEANTAFNGDYFGPVHERADEVVFDEAWAAYHIRLDRELARAKARARTMALDVQNDFSPEVA